MADAKKAGSRRAKAAQKTDLIDMANATVAEAQHAVEAIPAPAPAAKSAAAKSKPVETGIFFSSVQEQGDTFRQAVRQAAAVSAQGVLEVNGKILDAFRIQSETALDLWRTAISVPSLPDAFQAQSTATRQAYETASSQWKDIAETTARWFTKSIEPLHTALQRPAR